jgi:hypothetical protein
MPSWLNIVEKKVKHNGIAFVKSQVIYRLVWTLNDFIWHKLPVMASKWLISTFIV